VIRSASVFALAATLALGAQAATDFDLRYLSASRNWSGNDSDVAVERFDDIFNNSNLQSGGVWSSGFTAQANLYTVTNGVGLTESTPGDYLFPDGALQGQQIGQFRFSTVNATAPTPIVINGSSFIDQTHRIRLNGPISAGSSEPRAFFNTSQSKFIGDGVFNFVTPATGERYGIRMTDVGTDIGTPEFDDLISLDVINLNGAAAVQMRRIAGDGVGGPLSSTQGQIMPIADFLDPGASLSDIKLIGLSLRWTAESKLLRGEVDLIGFDSGEFTGLGYYGFGNGYSIFNGEEVTRLQAGASWTQTTPVPEPSTYGLMLAGLAGVAWAARRRRRA